MKPGRIGPLVAGVASLVTLGCGGPDDTSRPEGQAGVAGDGASMTGQMEAPISRHLGLFTVADGWVFTPCRGTPVAIDGPAAPELLEIYQDFVPEDAAPREIFVDLLGRFRGDGGDWLDALDLRRVYDEGWACDGDVAGILLEGSGTEPFWTVLVETDAVSWSTPGGTEAFEHEGLEWSDRGSRVVAGVQAESGRSIEVEAWEEPCRDAMSGAWYHMVMEATLDGRTYTGCAYLGVEVEAAGAW